MSSTAECGICYELYDRPHDEMVALPCNHRICKVCVGRLHRCICPFCRRPFEESLGQEEATFTHTSSVLTIDIEHGQPLFSPFSRRYQSQSQTPQHQQDETESEDEDNFQEPMSYPPSRARLRRRQHHTILSARGRSGFDSARDSISHWTAPEGTTSWQMNRLLKQRTRHRHLIQVAQEVYTARAHAHPHSDSEDEEAEPDEYDEFVFYMVDVLNQS